MDDVLKIFLSFFFFSWVFFRACWLFCGCSFFRLVSPSDCCVVKMSRMGHVNTYDEVIEAFRVFDKDGLYSFPQPKHIPPFPSLFIQKENKRKETEPLFSLSLSLETKQQPSHQTRKTGQGYIMADEFRQILNDLGDYMDPNEVCIVNKKKHTPLFFFSSHNKTNLQSTD